MGSSSSLTRAGRELKGQTCNVQRLQGEGAEIISAQKHSVRKHNLIAFAVSVVAPVFDRMVSSAVSRITLALGLARASQLKSIPLTSIPSCFRVHIPTVWSLD